MTSVRTVRLEDVAEDVTVGHVGPMAEEYLNEGIPFLRSLNVQPFRISTHDIRYISPEFHRKLKKSALSPGDVVIVRTGKPGTCAVIPETVPVANCSDLVIVRCGPLLRPRFLAYWVNAVATDHVATHIVGAVQQHFNVGSARRMPIVLPSAAEQDRILSILGVLDDKIELNRRMSSTLEAMARALFRSWFVDFDPVRAKAEGQAPVHMDAATATLFPDRFGDGGLPEGWKLGQLGNLAESPRRGVKPSEIDPSTPYIGLEHMPQKSIALSDWETAEKVGSQKSVMKAGDFLFGKLRPYFHKVGIVPVDGICSTDIVVVRAKRPEWAGFVLAMISSDCFVEHTAASSSGTRMPRTSWSDMQRFEVVMPSVQVAAAYESWTKPWREQIVANIHQSRTLAALRDALLPKLMSGELRVRDAERQVAEVA